jgi:predicted nucleic acid-binding protein
MSGFIVDASVAIQWLVEEADSERADAFYEGYGPDELQAPELIIAEVCNIAWRKATKREIPARQAIDIAASIGTLLPSLLPSAALAGVATEIALEINHPIYDCFYLASADLLNVQLVTVDQRLLKKLSATRYAGRAVHLHAVP